MRIARVASLVLAGCSLVPGTEVWANGYQNGWCNGVGNPHHSLGCAAGGVSVGGTDHVGAPEAVIPSPTAQVETPSVVRIPSPQPQAAPMLVPQQVPQPTPVAVPPLAPGLVAVPPQPQAAPMLVPQQVPQPTPHLVPDLGSTVVPRPVPSSRPVRIPVAVSGGQTPPAMISPQTSTALVVPRPGRQPAHELPARERDAGPGRVTCLASGFGWRKVSDASGKVEHAGLAPVLRTPDMLLHDLPANHPRHADCLVRVERRLED